MSDERLRIDKLLWFLRLAKTRTRAKSMAEAGHLRVNGGRVTSAHQLVSLGDVLTVPVGRQVRVVEILALPARRGPAPDARKCYRELDGGPAQRIGASD